MSDRSVDEMDADLVGVAVWRCGNGEGTSDEAGDELFNPMPGPAIAPGSPSLSGSGGAISRDLARLMGGDLVYTRTDRTESKLPLPVDVSRCRD